MKNRREFLKNAGSTALFTSLGSSFFISCDEATEEVNPNPTLENGFTQEGNIYTIDLNHSDFSSLKNNGSWKLFSEGEMLLVNVGSNIYRAFTNSCPHSGCSDSWGYSNNNFTCTCHTSIFSNNGSFISGPANQDLKSFTCTLDRNILTVTK